jgi:hypothetical protein
VLTGGGVIWRGCIRQSASQQSGAGSPAAAAPTPEGSAASGTGTLAAKSPSGGGAPSSRRQQFSAALASMFPDDGDEGDGDAVEKNDTVPVRSPDPSNAPVPWKCRVFETPKTLNPKNLKP